MLVGIAVSYLLSMHMRRVMPVMAAATLSSLGVLLAFFDWFEPFLQSANADLARYFAWVMLAGLLILGWIYSAVKKWIARPAVTTDEDAIPVPTPAPAEGTG